MSEIKGLLWYNLSQSTLIITCLFMFLGVGYKLIWLIMGFAVFDAIFGALEYFGIMDKIKRKLKYGRG